MEIKFDSFKIDKWFVRTIPHMLHEKLKARVSAVKTGRLFEYSEVKNMGKAFSRYLENNMLSFFGLSEALSIFARITEGV